MLICYIDESGTPDIPGNTTHFILSGLSIPADHWKTCDSEIANLKKKYDLVDKEIHTAWLLRPLLEQTKIKNFKSKDYTHRRLASSQFRKKELLRLQRSNHKLYKQTRKNYKKTEDYTHLIYDERKKLVLEFSEIIAKWDFARLFAECIDKVYFDPHYSGSTIEEQSFEQVVTRFEKYLQVTSSNNDKNIGMLIHDNNPTLAKRLTKLMISFHKKGTLWTSVTHIIETPLFVDSKLTAMVQVADLCSYALRRYLENNDEDLFNNIFSRADRYYGKVVGVRHFAEKSCVCKICTSR